MSINTNHYLYLLEVSSLNPHYRQPQPYLKRYLILLVNVQQN